MKVEEGPANPVSNKRSTDHGQPSTSSKSTVPSLGILRDTPWRNTRYKAPCTHYSKGKCNLGHMCNFSHPESNAPPGWRFSELEACGDEPWDTHNRQKHVYLLERRPL